ncbi:MAG TPA: FecR domain-containing protein [Polyangiales bacterium]|jgi:TolA-binding protein
MTEFERENARLDELSDRARLLFAAVSSQVERAGRQQLMAAALTIRPRSRLFGRAFDRAPRTLSRWLFLPLLAAAAAAVLLLWPFRPSHLTYEIRGGQRTAANYVDAVGNAPATVEFSDGSRAIAAAGARLRIDRTEERGARVFVERGSTTAHIQHRDHSNWLFIAGPFDVHITGTRFTLAWDPREQAIDLTLHEGSVEVDSPLGSSHCIVRAGQRFRASLSAGTMQLENDDANATQASADAVVVTAPSSATDERKTARDDKKKRALTIARSHPPLDSANERAWSDLVRSGDFRAVVTSAAQRGIELSLRSADASELRALADAARYTGETELAERSLSTLRTRFPGTKQSAAAAFLLGRTLESRGAAGEAEQYFAIYLNEEPRGEFASEALAGRMRVVAATRGAAAAKPMALEYLRRYRGGVHAETARRLASGD